jgi:hypothetical protein
MKPISPCAALTLIVGVLLSPVLLSPGSARAQLGRGWVQYDPPSMVQLDDQVGSDILAGTTTSASNAGATFTNQDGIETFTLFNPASNRCERRMRNDYSSGRRQFEGEVRVSPPTNDESIQQIFGGAAANATTQMIRAFSENNGTLKRYGSTVLATNIYDTWVRINVIHDVEADLVRTYIDGALASTAPGQAPSTWYHKYGCYGSLRTPSAKVEWRNVKHFRDGQSPPDGESGDAGTGDVTGAPDAGASGPDASGTPADAGAPDLGGGAGGSGGGGGNGGAGAGGSPAGGSVGAGGSSGAGNRAGAAGSGGAGASRVDAGGRAAAEDAGGCSCSLRGGGGPAGLSPLIGLIAHALLRRRRRWRAAGEVSAFTVGRRP